MTSRRRGHRVCGRHFEPHGHPSVKGTSLSDLLSFQSLPLSRSFYRNSQISLLSLSTLQCCESLVEVLHCAAYDVQQNYRSLSTATAPTNELSASSVLVRPSARGTGFPDQSAAPASQCVDNRNEESYYGRRYGLALAPRNRIFPRIGHWFASKICVAILQFRGATCLA